VKNISIFTNEENFTQLKWLDLSNNKFTELVGIKSPKLEYLDIGYNKLEKVNESWTGHPNVKILNSVDNRFKNLVPFKDMPKLEELYLASNAVSNIIGWDSLPSLKRLHLRKNKIEKIDEELPPLDSLVYLNLRGNKLSTID
jgi:Leucine-rich repeat (LRR) protein